jgi:26S proteasome regulatory subunit N2
LQRTILTRNISEALYEGDELPKPARDAAALVASKVYYFLGEYDEALSFALASGNAFQVETRAYGSEEYVETIICAFILSLPGLCIIKNFLP